MELVGCDPLSRVRTSIFTGVIVATDMTVKVTIVDVVAIVIEIVGRET